VRIRTGGENLSVALAPGERKTVAVRPGAGLPYRPLTFPTNYLYSISITSEINHAFTRIRWTPVS